MMRLAFHDCWCSLLASVMTCLEVTLFLLLMCGCEERINLTENAMTHGGVIGSKNVTQTFNQKVK
jgi:hypothetical protein